MIFHTLGIPWTVLFKLPKRMENLIWKRTNSVNDHGQIHQKSNWIKELSAELELLLAIDSRIYLPSTAVQQLETSGDFRSNAEKGLDEPASPLPVQ